MQYTLRGIPGEVDAAIRERARAEGKSLNEVAVQALARSMGLGSGDLPRRDLSDVAGTWARDAAAEAAFAAQDVVDESLWR